MGDMADSIIEGEVCQQCGEYLDGDSPGYPRYCSGCQPRGVKTGRINSSKPNKMYQNYNKKSKSSTTGENAVRGVKNFLKNKIMNEEDFVVVCNTYLIELVSVDNNIVGDENNTIQFVCNEIQKDFGKFVKWFKATYK